jgi:hypothetical protein
MNLRPSRFEYRYSFKRKLGIIAFPTFDFSVPANADRIFEEVSRLAERNEFKVRFVMYRAAGSGRWIGTKWNDKTISPFSLGTTKMTEAFEKAEHYLKARLRPKKPTTQRKQTTADRRLRSPTDRDRRLNKRPEV